jgi:hypothetical protein
MLPPLHPSHPVAPFGRVVLFPFYPGLLSGAKICRSSGAGFAMLYSLTPSNLVPANSFRRAAPEPKVKTFSHRVG